MVFRVRNTTDIYQTILNDALNVAAGVTSAAFLQSGRSLYCLRGKNEDSSYGLNGP
ncbi:hypothetical protein SAMN04488522_102666 [Pedobacter caeni]|uniref:Uncharacterized protein n=1 Tax=Pedobacter caeni TaxID=288992 RepID=A0A1M5ABC1_9SPHI|nr:hypothetical protein SAMN04488522_102666 [Pedobacter caeni]